jgi:hypothetical protein
MGIYYGVVVGYGFEVPLENIKTLPEYGESGNAEETLDSHLYKNGYEYLTVVSAHAYDADDQETQFVIGIDRLTEDFDSHDAFGLVILEDKVMNLTTGENQEVSTILSDLGLPQETPLAPFVAPYLS